MAEDVMPIPLGKAAEKFGIPYKELLRLAKENKITLVCYGTAFITDENSIKAYLDLKEKNRKMDKYRAELLEEKEEELNEIISRYDDFLFSMRTISKMTRLFKILIYELAEVIKDDFQRKVFIEVSFGQSIYKVACDMGFSYDKICSIYTYTVNLVAKKCGLITKYRKTMAQLLLDVRQKEIEIRNLREYVDCLENYKQIEKKYGGQMPVPTEAIYILTKSLEKDMSLARRTINTLHEANIYTVEDLMRYLAKHEGKFKSLLRIHNFGKNCFEDLKENLLKLNIIDCNGNSYLLKYMII